LDADVRFIKASYDLSRDCHLEPLAYSFPTGYGHDGERQAWLLTGAKPDNQEAASRVQPQTAYCRPTKGKFHPEISVDRTVVFVTPRNHVLEQHFFE
jgi:hypothetical protein